MEDIFEHLFSSDISEEIPLSTAYQHLVPPAAFYHFGQIRRSEKVEHVGTIQSNEH